ncbi:hypothetical protein [Actinomadura violacea]|uniref:Uncharacterized protein n=1 Tax=Actinomadura violacea TaxID=2819934 RepID=A0ABS3RYR2_9ACTN|nr:hypothetical protein [Actinomadura violacea]MBO2461598.1 hypothetical protein [Actinomadura violacea]
MDDATPQPAPPRYPDAPAPGMHAAPPYQDFSGTRPAPPAFIPLLPDTPIYDRLAAEWKARTAEPATGPAEAPTANREPQADQPDTDRPEGEQAEEPKAEEPGGSSRRTRKRGNRHTPAS